MSETVALDAAIQAFGDNFRASRFGPHEVGADLGTRVDVVIACVGLRIGLGGKYRRWYSVLLARVADCALAAARAAGPAERIERARAVAICVHRNILTTHADENAPPNAMASDVVERATGRLAALTSE